jgi:hypothetical protein
MGLLLAISEREAETKKIIERPRVSKTKKKKTAEG